MRKLTLLAMWVVGSIICMQAQTVTVLDGIRYLIEDGYAVVGRQNVELTGDIMIPESIKYGKTTYPVTQLVEPTNLTAWSNNTVTTEGGAFQSCGISSIILPNSIKVIPAGTFAGCGYLTKVKLPTGLTQIGAAAFSSCTALDSLDIPATVVNFGSNSAYGFVSNTFGNCGVKTITIPAGVKTLYEGCFKGSKLDSIFIPSTITEIQDEALETSTLRVLMMGVADLSKLKYSKISFGAASNINTDLFVPKGSLAVYEQYEPWNNFRSLQEYGGSGQDFKPDQINVVYNEIRYILKDGKATIARQKTSISGKVIIPESIEYENVRYPVLDMLEPTDLTCYSSNTISCVGGVFQGSNIDTLVLPATITKIAAGAFQNCRNLKQVVLPETMKQLGAACFAGCGSLEDINFPESITDLASNTRYGYRSYVFGGCSSLKSVVVPSKVKQLASGCLQGSGVVEVTIPANCKVLDEGSLNASHLRTLTLYVRDMYSMTFSESTFGNVSQDTLRVPMGSKQVFQEYYPWKSFASIVEFDDGEGEYVPTKITTMIDGLRYVIDKGVATVGRQDKDLAGEIVIPDTVVYKEVSYPVTGMIVPTDITAWSSNRTTTENGAFQSCPITAITIPNTIKMIGAGAFNGCRSLTQVTLPAGLKQLGAACFAGCTSLKELQLPDSVTLFGSNTKYGFISYIFGECSLLKKVNIPSGVTKLSEGCFKGSGLEIFLIPENVDRLEEDCFDMNGLKAIKITHRVLNELTYTESIFSNVSNTSLYVPQATASTYAQFYPWKNFKEIKEYIDQDDEFNFNAYSITYLLPNESNTMIRQMDGSNSVYQTNYVASGVEIDEIIPPTMEGKEFVKWIGVPSVMPSRDIVLTAEFRDLPNALDEVAEAQAKARIIVLDGCMYVCRDGKTYTIQGILVK